ncbi:MAG TPA: HNH endonuclease [Paracoccaceae bacterium]|nr:HNH endonuclease [Paracoccaceae bacterium]
MAKAVFTHADGSIYDDLPESRYHFPRTYLRQAERAVGDWVLFYEPRRVEAGSERTGGRQVCFAAAEVARIRPDPRRAGMFHAYMTPGTYVPFPSPVAFRMDGLFMEGGLRKPDGSTNKGAFGRAVRILPDAEFEAIVAAGLAGVRDELGAEDWAPAEAPASAEPPRPWGAFRPDDPVHAQEPPGQAPRRPLVERLTARRLRDAAFARQVKAAYRETCAMTGLRILNGGGRPEVQAAHIRPVERDGPDALRNGLALSGTAHWMFDRGLVSVDDDGAILTAGDRLPPGAAALLRSERRLLMPSEGWARPHPTYLRRHRRNVFKG